MVRGGGSFSANWAAKVARLALSGRDAAEPYYRAAAATLAARLTAAERAKVVFKRPGGSAAAMCKPVQAERGIVLLLYIVATAACCSGTGRPMLRSPQCSCCFREVREGGMDGMDTILYACLRAIPVHSRRGRTPFTGF